MERTISVWSDRNIRDQLWNVSPVSLFCILLARTITKRALAWVLVCATGMYRSIEHVKLPKFQTGIFVEWKAPKEERMVSIYKQCRLREKKKLNNQSGALENTSTRHACQPQSTFFHFFMVLAFVFNFISNFCMYKFLSLLQFRGILRSFKSTNHSSDSPSMSCCL